MSIQAQVVNLLEDLQAELDSPISSLRTIWRWYAISQTIGVMYLGTIVEESSSEELLTRCHALYTSP